jgi:hypothetical protein
LAVREMMAAVVTDAGMAAWQCKVMASPVTTRLAALVHAPPKIATVQVAATLVILVTAARLLARHKADSLTRCALALT